MCACVDVAVFAVVVGVVVAVAVVSLKCPQQRNQRTANK